MISKIILIALLVSGAQSKILRRKVNSIEEPIVEQGSEIQDSAALEAIEPIGQEASQPLDIYDEGESTKPQIGAMIGLEWEIRGIQVTELKRGRRRGFPSCVRSGRILWKCPGFGEVAADQTRVAQIEASGCAEYVSDPIPVKEYNRLMPLMAKAVDTQIQKIKTTRKSISSVFSGKELEPETDPEKSTDCATSANSYVKIGTLNMPSPQLTFSTSLAGLNRLDIAANLKDSTAKSTWAGCKTWCEAQDPSLAGPHLDDTFMGFCTLACHYGNTHVSRGTLKRPACKEFPKALSKHAIQDTFLMVNKYEPEAFTALQTLFDAVTAGTIEAQSTGAALYFKCLNTRNFGATQLGGNGQQYRGTDAECVDWDYHGQCYGADVKKYPPSRVTAGQKTKAVLDHKEIYKRKAFCKYGDSPSTDVCTSPKTLVVIEMRESDSPIVSGAHNECEGSTSLQDFLTVVSSGVESKRQSGHFSEFLAELISHGT